MIIKIATATWSSVMFRGLITPSILPSPISKQLHSFFSNYTPLTLSQLSLPCFAISLAASRSKIWASVRLRRLRRVSALLCFIWTLFDRFFICWDTSFCLILRLKWETSETSSNLWTKCRSAWSSVSPIKMGNFTDTFMRRKGDQLSWPRHQYFFSSLLIVCWSFDKGSAKWRHMMTPPDNYCCKN